MQRIVTRYVARHALSCRDAWWPWFGAVSRRACRRYVRRFRGEQEADRRPGDRSEAYHTAMSVRLMTWGHDGLLLQVAGSAQCPARHASWPRCQTRGDPKAVKKATRAMHPIDNAVYSAQRSVATSVRSGRKGKARVYRHGNCPVHHRTPEAATRCRNR